MNTHLLRTYTDESLVEKYKNKYQVTVAWTIDFKDELLPSLDVLHKNYAVDPNKLKRGVGSLIVEISSDAIQSEKIAAFVGEVLAVTQILDENGVNAFGFEIETSVIRHQMAVEVSQDLSLKLLTGIDLDIDSLPSEEHTSFGLALSSAAYLFGCNFTTGTDHSWAQPYINESNKFDYNNAISAFSLEKRLRVQLGFGEILITPKTIREYLALPFCRFQREERGYVEGRPFDKVMKIIAKSDAILGDNHDHTISARRSLGENALAIFNQSAHVTTRLSPASVSSKKYYAAGFRMMHSEKMRKQLIDLGYLKAGEQ